MAAGTEDRSTGRTIGQLADDLAAGRVTARELVEECLDRIGDPDGQGGVAFMTVDGDGARAAADAMDMLRRAGAEPSRFAGIPISVKDLFDIRGQVTRAGSRVLEDRAPADRDAPAVARLRAAGFVLIGRTNMTEFAYSGLGLNPHYGNPRSPWRRDEGFASGGSTSGGAVSVADGMAHAALGTDTGGSCRIPAAWCGITGFKPTARRIPQGGAVPLSTTLDSVGPIGRSVECCAALDAILAQEEAAPLAACDVQALRIGVVENVVNDGIEDAVAAACQAAADRLARAGARVERVHVTAFDRVAGMLSKGGFSAAEAYAWHRDLLAEAGDRYDPRVSVRIRRGMEQDAADFVQLIEARAALIAEAESQLAAYDAILMPTTPILPPALAALEQDDAHYGRINLLALRNPTLINMIDGCAISLPVPSDAPVGITLAATAGRDRSLLSAARAVEDVLGG